MMDRELAKGIGLGLIPLAKMVYESKKMNLSDDEIKKFKYIYKDERTRIGALDEKELERYSEWKSVLHNHFVRSASSMIQIGGTAKTRTAHLGGMLLTSLGTELVASGVKKVDQEFTKRKWESGRK